MNRLAWTAAVLLACASPSAAVERYRVQEEGGFGSTGRSIEFDDRYGWASYAVDFDFSLSETEKELAAGSTLRLTIHKKEGGDWKYTCRVQEGDTPQEKGLWANVNPLYGKGISVMAECYIPPKKFSTAVDLHPELLKDSRIVFHVMIEDGKVRSSNQKGLYFPDDEALAIALRPFAAPNADPAELGVLFAEAASVAYTERRSR